MPFSKVQNWPGLPSEPIVTANPSRVISVRTTRLHRTPYRAFAARISCSSFRFFSNRSTSRPLNSSNAVTKSLCSGSVQAWPSPMALCHSIRTVSERSANSLEIAASWSCKDFVMRWNMPASAELASLGAALFKPTCLPKSAPKIQAPCSAVPPRQICMARSSSAQERRGNQGVVQRSRSALTMFASCEVAGSRSSPAVAGASHEAAGVT